VSGRKIENLISGADRSTNSVEELDLSAINDRRSANANTLEADLVSKIAQLDVGALLNAGTQGQGASQEQDQSQPQLQPQNLGLTPAGPSDINTSNVGADLANQIAAGNTPSVGTGDINTGNVGTDLANQIAGFDTTAAARNQTFGQQPAVGQAQAAAEARPSGQGQSQGLRPAGPSDIDTSNIAGDLANQLAPAPGVNGQRPESNNIAGDLANQLAGGAAPNGQGQVAAAQNGGAGAAIIEIRSTIIQEANGQQIATQVIQQQGQGQQLAATAPAEAKTTEAPAPMPIPSEALSKSTAAEAASKPETQSAQPSVEGMSSNVSD
jgi:hypothetical protein